VKRITKKNEDYKGIEWVLKARSKEITRYNMNFINVKDGEFIATDGHRLHIYKFTVQIEDGNYELINANSDEIILEISPNIEYPEWKHIIPSKEPTKIIEIRCYSKNLSVAYTDLVRAVPNENTVNLDYFKDINSINNTVIFSVFEKNEPIKFVSGRHRGLIMPMRTLAF